MIIIVLYRYELEDLAGEKIAGRFAPEELQKTIKDETGVWKIEKVIRKVTKTRTAILFSQVAWISNKIQFSGEA